VRAKIVAMHLTAHGALLAAITASLLSTQAHAAETFDECLLRQARQADAATTAGELRLRCAEAQRAHSAEAPASAASAVSAADTLISRLGTRPAEALSLFERRAASELRAVNEPFALLPHRPNYLLPLSYQWRPADSRTDSRAFRQTEAHLQLSFKFPLTPPLFGDRVLPFFGYTGRSWWQVFDSSRSRPFREYNHEPEVFLAWIGQRYEYFGWTHQFSTLGLTHQSNGRTLDGSRSWNRVFGEFYLDRGQSQWATLKLWARIREDAKRSIDDTSGDDNPDIERFLGNFELKWGAVLARNQRLTATMRQSLRSGGKGALQLDWSRPFPGSPSLRISAQAFDGYGDSLADYNVRVRRIGLGVMLNDWL
jgi:phospholipase A1